jgi:Spy/CpxP family protein refolding chaperone
MKRFTPARLIGPIGLLVIATAAGTAMGQPPTQGQQPTQGQDAPTTCPSEAASASPEVPNPNQSVSGDPYGPEKLIADALSKTCLSDQQRTAIEQLGKDVKAKEDVAGEARRAYVKALAEQERTDHVDATALKPEIDAYVKAREDASPVTRKALEDLHKILDSGQRAAFVDALEADMKQLRDASAGWLDKLSSDLGLTDGQKERVKNDITQAKADNEADRDKVKAEFESFKGDDFSIEKVSPGSEVGSRARARLEKMATVAKEIADILTPEQRSRLADKIEGKAAGEAPATGAPGTATPYPGTPSPATPYPGTPSTGTPSTGTPGTPTPVTPSTPTPMGTSHQGLFVGGAGFRAGAVGGWGGGFGWGGAARFGGYRMGMVGGYPFMGGWGPGIW